MGTGILLKQSPTGKLLRGTADSDILGWDNTAKEWIVRSGGAVIIPALNGPDETAIINAALLNNVSVILGIGFHRITGPIFMTRDSSSIMGMGPFNGTTIIVDSPAAIDVFNVQAQQCYISNLRIVGARVYQTGFCVKTNGFAIGTLIERCLFQLMGNGIWFFQSVTNHVRDCSFGDLFGTVGILGQGANTGTTEDICIDGITVFGFTYPRAITGASNWAPATPFAIGNIVQSNGNLYQCIANGVSGGVALSGIPTTDPSTARTTPILDGTTQWLYVSSLFSAMVQDSYCNTFDIGPDVGTINGGFGFRMMNTLAGTAPIIARINGSQFDHPFSRGLYFEAGTDVEITAPWISSILLDNAIEVTATFGERFSITGGQVFGCPKDGVILSKGNFKINGLNVGNCSVSAANTYSGIVVTAGISGWTIGNCVLGRIVAGSQQKYGLQIQAGAGDNFIASNNLFPNNLTLGNVCHGFQNDAVGANKNTNGNIGWP